MKKAKILIIVFLLLLFPFKTVNAAQANISLSCPQTASAGDIAKCNINVSSSDNLNGISAKYQFSQGTYYQNFTLSNQIFNVKKTSSKGFVLGNTKGLPSDFLIGTLEVSLPLSISSDNKYTIALTNISASDMNYNDITIADVSSSIRILSDDSSLKTLSVDKEQLEISSTNTTYNLIIDQESVFIDGKPTNQNATIKGLGQKTLNYGNNKFSILVTAENGKTTTYIINIIRPDNRSNDNNLSSIKLSTGNINFSPEMTAYLLEVEEEISKITIDATLANTKSTFIKGLGPRTVNLNHGSNIIEIGVKSESGIEKIYTINITRKEKKSSNTYLERLLIGDTNIELSKDKFHYELSVANEMKEVLIDAKAQDDKSKISGLGVKKLSVGRNEFTIKVTAEDGKEKEYKITVIRDEKITETPQNKIKDLIIKGSYINFSKDIKEYIITTTREKLDIKVELEDQESSYIIEGNENLQDGSIVKIIVKDKNNNKNVYTLLIKKDNSQTVSVPNTQAFSPKKSIVIALCLLISGTSIIYIAIKRKKIKKTKQ